MSGHVRALADHARSRLTSRILAQRIRARHPTLRSHPDAIWDYSYRDIESIEIGLDVTVGAFAEILVYRRSKHSSVEGKLILEDRSVITTGVNLRAAGGSIRIGAGTGVGQHSVVVAANHAVLSGEARIHTGWDEERCGVDIGCNVWIGALSVVLPGTTIGDDAIVAAGSVVTRAIPAGELWGGVPARKIRDVEVPASISPS